MALRLPLRGRCLCGSVCYEIVGQPLMASICHCTTCQKRTGSAFSMNLPVTRSDFQLTSGTTIIRELPTGSGNTNVHHFCNDCLVRTHTEPRRNPVIVYVRPGTLDDPKAIEPAIQIWARSALPWAVQPLVSCFEEDIPKDGVAAAVGRWRAAHPIA